MFGVYPPAQLIAEVAGKISDIMYDSQAIPENLAYGRSYVFIDCYNSTMMMSLMFDEDDYVIFSTKPMVVTN